MFTPKIVASGAEGGATLFEINYFGKKAYLAQSPAALQADAHVDRPGPGIRDRTGVPGRTFRYRQARLGVHIFDAEMAHIDSQRDVMAMLEGVHAIRHQGRHGAGQGAAGEAGHATVVLPKAPYPVITYADAMDMVNGGRIQDLNTGDDLGTEGEKVLGDIMMEKGYEMYWIVEYPEEAKPFYIMEKDGTPYSYSFDLDYKGQEMASGGQREHRYDRLRPAWRRRAWTRRPSIST